ncbi:MAG: YIP1 family protein [Anaerolineae bacterium]
MDINAMLQTWMNVLTKPGEAVFEAERERPYANLTTALIWVVVAGVLVAIFSGIGFLIQGAIGGGASAMQSLLGQAELPPEVADQLLAYTAGGVGGTLVGAFCGGLILTPLFFLIGSGIYWIIAKLFGGTGSFEGQTYLLATFGAPLMVVSGLVGIVPFGIGGCLSFLVSIYQLVLTYFAVKVSHGLTSGKALGVILIPVAVLLVCVVCGVVVFLIIGAGAIAGSGQF